MLVKGLLPIHFSVQKPRLMSVVPVVVALLLALPIIVIVTHIFSGSYSLWQHLWQSVLADYVTNSLLLMLGVAVGVLLLGVPTAWLTSACEFPGRKLFSWALLLPLAFPAYIIAYTHKFT